MLGMLQATALFILQLLICEIVYFVYLPKRDRFQIRFPASLVLFLGLVVLSAWLRTLLPDDGSYAVSELKGILYFTLVILCNAVMIYLSFDVHYSGALFVVISGYSIEHIASRVSYILKVTVLREMSLFSPEGILLFALLIPIVSSLVIFFALLRRGFEADSLRYDDKKVLVISGVNLFICIVLSTFEPDIGISSAVEVLGNPSVEEILTICTRYFSAILGCVLCLCLQVGYFRENKLEERNRTLSEMLELEREKEILSKETVDIINQKCHDLRHQISLLEMQTPEDRAKSLKNISDAILIYDSIAKTGNSSVDLVLMEKKLLCDKHGIQFNYMVDGSKFNFMDEADIYVMLGNMLENAIESVSKEEDPESKIITFIARARGSMLYICLENYCSSEVKFRDDLPETIKQDKAFHGFGTKSIAHIAESYGGNARFSMENDYFIAEVLLPIPDKGSKRGTEAQAG